MQWHVRPLPEGEGRAIDSNREEVGARDELPWLVASRHHLALHPAASSIHPPAMPSPSALERFSTAFYISYCDQPTLEALSRVNLACLEMGSSLLYADVVIRRDEPSIRSLFRIWVSSLQCPCVGWVFLSSSDSSRNDASSPDAPRFRPPSTLPSPSRLE